MKMLMLFKPLLQIGIALFGMVTVVAAHESQQPSNVTFCYEEMELYPYFMGNGLEVPETNPGVTIELIQSAFAQHDNIKLKMERAPWSRCLVQLKEGKVDTVYGAYDEDRESFAAYPRHNDVVDYSSALPGLSYCLFTHISSPLAWDNGRLTGFKDQTLVVPRSYSITKLLDELDIPFEETYSGHLALELLIGNRANGSINFCIRGESLLGHLSDDPNVFKSDLIRHQPGFLIVNKQFFPKYPHFTKNLWRDLKTQRNEKSGALMLKYKSIQPSHLQ